MHQHLPPPKPYYYHVPSPFASIIKVPPKVDLKEIPYGELPCTAEDQAIIYEVITTMAYNNLIKLGFKASHLNEIGEKINHVHPLKFLSTILNHPELKSCLHLVFESSFKTNGLMGRDRSNGLETSLNRESDKGKLKQYIPDFAKEIGVSPEEIYPYFESREWDLMVRHLMLR